MCLRQIWWTSYSRPNHPIRGATSSKPTYTNAVQHQIHSIHPLDPLFQVLASGTIVILLCTASSIKTCVFATDEPKFIFNSSARNGLALYRTTILIRNWYLSWCISRPGWTQWCIARLTLMFALFSCAIPHAHDDLGTTIGLFECCTYHRLFSV